MKILQYMQGLLLVVFLTCAAMLAGCGVEMATTAATTAALKKQEVEAAKQTKDMVDQKLNQATQAMQQRNQQQSDADK